MANLIDSADPDIIIGTETWLNCNVKNSEIFRPEQYEVERNDRPDGYGGVLIAAKKVLASHKISIKAAGEEIWVKITRRNKSPFIIGALYRPPKSDLAYMQNLCKSAETLIKDNKNAIFWIGGDLNLPDIDWNLNAVQGHQYIKTINDEFLQFLQDNTLQQIVTKPTKNNNILYQHRAQIFQIFKKVGVKLYEIFP